jgi:hypothetical protein
MQGASKTREVLHMNKVRVINEAILAFHTVWTQNGRSELPNNQHIYCILMVFFVI